MQTAIGVDLGASHVAAAVVTDDGTIHVQHEEELEDLRFEAVIAAIRSDRRTGAQRCRERVVGIGIGSPGNIDAAPEPVLYSPNFGWDERAAGRHVAQEVCSSGLRRQRRPLRDAGRVHVRHRHGLQRLRAPHPRDGHRRRHRGAGKLLLGNRWGAGEIGHHQIRPTDGFVCACGKIGCFEAQASGTGLIRHAFAVAPSFPRSSLLDVPPATSSVRKRFEKRRRPATRTPCRLE
jgi:glucokinase